MDVEVFIYGTPTGNCFYGQADEKIYFDTFYNGDKENYLSIKIRKAGDNKVYCYYNYLVYQNVIGKNGRPGSFFGITLRLDAYCLNIKNIYGILDITFNSYVRGELFDDVGGNLRYIVDDFNDTLKLESIKDLIIRLFSWTFKGKENVCFAPIDRTFMLEGGKLYAINLYDYSDEDVFRFVKETGQIRISPYYLTQEIGRQKQQHDKHLEEIRQQHEFDRKTDLEEKNKLSSSLSESKNKIINLQAEVEQKKKDIEQLNGKIKNIERAKEIERLIEQIRIPIEKISDYIGHTAPVVANEIVRQGRKWYSRLFEIIRKGIPFVNMVLLALIIYCAFPVLKGVGNDPNANSSEIEELKEKIKELQRNNDFLEERLKTVHFPVDGIKNIDIENYSGSGALTKKKTYKAKLIWKGDIFQYEVEGANLEVGKDNTFSLTPNADKVHIRILVDGKIVAERSIPN